MVLYSLKLPAGVEVLKGVIITVQSKVQIYLHVYFLYVFPCYTTISERNTTKSIYFIAISSSYFTH